MLRDVIAKLTCAAIFSLAVLAVHAEPLALDDAAQQFRPNEKTRFFVADAGELPAEEVYTRIAEFRPFERGSERP